MEVDDRVVDEAAAWLFRVQRPEGGWTMTFQSSPASYTSTDYLVTAHVARVLAKIYRERSLADTKAERAVPQELRKALDFLAKQVERSNDPYLIASFALASIEVGDRTRADQALAKLRSLARKDGNSIYWSLEGYTPFYGWGLAARVETTALAMQALARSREINAGSETDEELMRSGLMFLLDEKDRYGVWYSTQATLNVLDTMLSLLARGGTNRGPAATEILVNGEPVNLPTVSVDEANSPRVIDISSAVHPGQNQIVVRRSAASYSSAQAVTSYYVPWSASRNQQTPDGAPSLSVAFDKNETHVNEVINCHVKVSRRISDGRGMMLVEIGLPPGADVDRESLEKVLKNSRWSINQYDVLPDRVVFYVWPQDRGSEFDFQFRPRFALKAKFAASSVYDYYNPEARAVVAPATLVVR
jgi:hypothetical protein